MHVVMRAARAGPLLLEGGLAKRYPKMHNLGILNPQCQTCFKLVDTHMTQFHLQSAALHMAWAVVSGVVAGRET